MAQNKVEAAYACSDLFERRRLMDDWSAYLREERGRVDSLPRWRLNIPPPYIGRTTRFQFAKDLLAVVIW